MKIRIPLVAAGLLAVFLGACSPSSGELPVEEHVDVDGATGRQGGRLLTNDGLTLELAINEAAGTAEFLAWIVDGDQRVDLESVQLTVELARLGGDVDVVQFTPADTYLVGDSIIREPHSFNVDVQLEYADRIYEWAYESPEGRTRIEPAMAEKFGLKSALAEGADIEETVKVFGQVFADPSTTVDVRARFPGMIQSISAEIGTRVNEGAELAVVESDESLKTYVIKAPAAGFVLAKAGNPGEHTAGRVLFQIVNPSRVWAEFRLFPSQRRRVTAGQLVRIRSAAGENLAEGVIDWIGLEARKDQSIGIRAPIDNSDGRLVPGMNLTGEILIATHPVSLAVRRSGLQSFRDFTVVYAQFGDVYEVRMLTLGRQDHTWVEVLDGLESGIRYVTENSYLVKADIDKDSASHDH